MSWDIANSNEFFGLQLFKTLFSLDEKILGLFSFANIPELYISDQFNEHKTKVIESLSTIIQNLSNLNDLNDYLTKLTQIHSPFKLTHYEFGIFNQALLATLKRNLGTKMTPDIEKAWQAALSHIASSIIGDMTSMGTPIAKDEDKQIEEVQDDRIKFGHHNQDQGDTESVELPPLDGPVPERTEAEQRNMLAGKDDQSDFDNIGLNKDESIY